MHNVGRVAGILLLLALCLVTITSAGAETIRIGGTGAALGTMQRLGAGFVRQRPDIQIEVLPSLGSGGGIKALIAGVIDLSVSARPLKDSEAGEGLEAATYGRTALVIAVSADRPEEDITVADLVAIYSGTLMYWPDGEKIRPLLRPMVETDTKLLERYIPELGAAFAAARARSGVPVLYTDQETADAVERIPGAVGPAALNLILSEGRALKALSLGGVAATPETIRDGRYPLTKDFYFVTHQDSGRGALAFIAFARSEEGAAILKETGHVLPPRDGGQ